MVATPRNDTDMAIDLNAFWTPFTSNRQFKAAPRLVFLAAAGMGRVFVVHSGFEACPKVMKIALAHLPALEHI